MSQPPDPTLPSLPTPLDDSPRSIRFFDPTRLRFWRTPGGVLRMEVAEEYVCLKTVVARAFPLSHPDEYLSFRDGGKKELGMLRRLRDVPQEARRLLEEEIDRRYFLPRIERIDRIRERFGIAEWEVATSRGPRKFTTKQVHDSAAETEPNRYLITDVDGNRYEIADARLLDPASASLLANLM